MSIYLKQLRTYVIQPSLKPLGLYSLAAEQLLLGTAAVESQLGHYLHQVNGPALGIYQMEPATHRDIWENYLRFNQQLASKIRALMPWSIGYRDDSLLIVDLRYATIMARLIYYRQKEQLPNTNNIKAQAKYWKKYYNTELGKGSADDYIATAKRYGLC